MSVVEFVTSIKDYDLSPHENLLWNEVNDRLDNNILCEKVKAFPFKRGKELPLDSRTMWRIATDPAFLLELEKDGL